MSTLYTVFFKFENVSMQYRKKWYLLQNVTLLKIKVEKKIAHSNPECLKFKRITMFNFGLIAF